MDNIRKTCGFYKILNNRNHGVTPQRALQIYRECIRPRIEYAVATFSNLRKNAVNMIKTNVNSYLRQGLSLMKFTLNHILYHMANELPPEYRYKLAATREIIKSILYKLSVCDYIDTLRSVNTSIGVIYNEYEFIFSVVGKSVKLTIRLEHVTLITDFFEGICIWEQT